MRPIGDDLGRKTLAWLAFVCALVAVSFARAEDWSKHASKVPALERQIEASEQEIRALVEQKEQIKDSGTLKQVLDQIAEKNKTLAKQLEEHRQLSLHIRFKHPDRDRTDERNYARQKDKATAVGGEGKAGLDSHLDRLKQRVNVTFPVPQDGRKRVEIPPEFKTQLRLPASLVEGEEAPERVILRASEPERDHPVDDEVDTSAATVESLDH